MPLFCPDLLPRKSEHMECDVQRDEQVPPRPPRPSSAELDGLAGFIGQPLSAADHPTHDKKLTKGRRNAPSDNLAPLPLSFRRTRSSYRRSTLPKLPTITDVSVEDLKTEVGDRLTHSAGTKAEEVDKQTVQATHYGCASTWPPRKADWRKVVHEWMSVKEETDSPAGQPSLTKGLEESLGREQSQVPELQPLDHQPAGSLLLEWQDRFNRSSEESGKPSSDASTLVSPDNTKKNKLNLPPPPAGWVPPKSAWSDTTASSIHERDGKGLRSRLRSLSLTRALRRVMERSPSPSSRSIDTKIGQILDDHDARLSAVRAKTHHKIVSKKVKRRSASDPDVIPKQRYQDVLEASENLKKRLLRRSVPDEKELLGSGSEETVEEKKRPKSLPTSRAPMLKLNTIVLPWV